MKRAVSTLLSWVAAVSMLLACSSTATPGGTVKEFYSLVDAGKISDAVKLIDLPPGTEPKVSAMLGEEAQHQKSAGGITSVEILKEDVTGEIASVDFKIHFKNPEVLKREDKVEHMKLAKIDGHWKLKLE